MERKIVIATRSINAQLYEMASSFWPEEIPRERITGMDDWRDALTYLHKLLNIDADYVVNCDEDCFVFDWKEVERIITVMEREGYISAGMPDTLENCKHRNNSADVYNPFFNVFRPSKMKDVIIGTPWYANAVLIDHNPASCKFPEVFNNFFVALWWKSTRLDLVGQDHEDGISTILGIGKDATNVLHGPFALHSWYSREYMNEGPHHERINALYHEACRRRTVQG